MLTHYRHAPDRGRTKAVGLAWVSLIRLLPLLWLLLPVNPAAGANSLSVKEPEIKAAFIFNFVKFVEWPPGTFATSDSPLVLGVAGQTPVTEALEAAVRGRKIRNRALVVRRVGAPASLEGVHLLYVPASEDHQLERLLSGVAGRPVLTIGETPAFKERDGVLCFVLVAEKLRFELNLEAAETARLQISAQLQKLAKSIRRRARP